MKIGPFGRRLFGEAHQWRSQAWFPDSPRHTDSPTAATGSLSIEWSAGTRGRACDVGPAVDASELNASEKDRPVNDPTRPPRNLSQAAPSSWRSTDGRRHPLRGSSEVVGQRNLARQWVPRADFNR